MPHLLEIEKLICGYEGGVVLEELSLHVAKGEVVAVLGRNGVGKTTLLKAIMGLIKARSGNIMLDDKPVTNLEPFQVARNGIGYVPQGREIFSDFTALENLALGARGNTDFSDVFSLFPVLHKRRNARAGTFSGGQQQQLAIARALVAQPKLLLLDEPLEGLQPSIVSEIANILERIAEKMNMGIILVEQNIDMVLSLGNRCLFLEGGIVAGEYAATELQSDPAIIETYLSI